MTSDTSSTPPPPPPGDRIEPVGLEVEMQRSYLDYAMSVIVGRALPDVRDGLKPVHRRVLYAMYDGGYRPDRGYNKCARVVGDVMGNYHPHGDTAIYDALVRLAQPWSMRMPLVDGNGNFGSPGNDPAAAMRYTEARLAPLAMQMLADIDEETVDFSPNYDGRQQEPDVLPARFPNLLDQRLGRHRGRDGDQHPAAQPARGRLRRPVVPGELRVHQGGAARGPPGAGEGPGLPDRRHDHRPARDAGRLPDRPRLDHHARGRRGGGERQGPHPARRHRAAVPGQPGQPGDEDRRARQRRQDAGDRRAQRRDLPAHRSAPGHRAQARRRRPGGAEQPLQAHPAAGHLRRQHAGAGRRGAAHPVPRRLRPALGDPPGRGHRPAHPVPAAQGRGPRSHPACAAQGPGRSRRGHRADPAQPDRRGGPRGPDGATRDRRASGHRDPRHAVAPPRRSRAAEDHRRVRRA